ncbi:MAG: hypothetical protein P4L90_07445 [Rhodopila sp.]|nr:hypothetical protein [Rhodopila sp.]
MARLMPLGAVHPIFVAALATGNHLLVQLKDNQGHLLDAAHAITARAVPAGAAVSTTIGRLRQRGSQSYSK